MKTDDIMKLVEAYRCAGGSAEHYARQDHLRTAIEALVDYAERYRWLKENMTYVGVGTYRAPNSELVSPMIHRWYHQTTDLTSNTLDELADASMEKQQ